MEATVCNLSDTRGDDVIVTLHFFQSDGTTPLDLSASTFAAQLRAYPDSATAVSFTADQTGLATGVLVLTIPHATAATLGQAYAWDLQQTTAGVIETPLKGTFTFDLDVTR